jgi:transcriptional regulator with XRE-family HTH domain
MSDRATLRRRAGLTQVQLSRKTAISAPRLCLWERGEVELSPEQVGKTAAVLHDCLSRTPAFSGTEELARLISPTTFASAGAA